MTPTALRTSGPVIDADDFASASLMTSPFARYQARNLHRALRAVGWSILEVAPDASWWVLGRVGDGRRMHINKNTGGQWSVMVCDRRKMEVGRNPFQRRSYENRSEMQEVDIDHRLLRDDDNRASMTALRAIAIAARYASDNPSRLKITDGAR